MAAINYIITTRPDVTLWIVTRLARFAAMIEHGDRAYIHFSLDRCSLVRRDEFLALNPKSRNYFFSYQCELDEIPPPSTDLRASVIFFRRYKPSAGADLADPGVCPLNTLADCTGACAACRRCFDGKAVSMRVAFAAPATPTTPP